MLAIMNFVLLKLDDCYLSKVFLFHFIVDWHSKFWWTACFLQLSPTRSIKWTTATWFCSLLIGLHVLRVAVGHDPSSQDDCQVNVIYSTIEFANTVKVSWCWEIQFFFLLTFLDHFLNHINFNWINRSFKRSMFLGVGRNYNYNFFFGIFQLYFRFFCCSWLSFLTRSSSSLLEMQCVLLLQPTLVGLRL